MLPVAARSFAISCARAYRDLASDLKRRRTELRAA
jgi:hypothetical protein